MKVLCNALNKQLITHVAIHANVPLADRHIPREYRHLYRLVHCRHLSLFCGVEAVALGPEHTIAS
jgi:hypothetical protein